MRLASYNVENLFDRAKVMNLDRWSDGRDVLNRFSALNRILGQQVYSAADKQEIVRLLRELGLERTDQSEFVLLRRNKGKLLSRPRAGGVVIVANGRADWTGGLELVDEAVDEEAMRNTARVIADVDADVLVVVEAENRPSLSLFNRNVLPQVSGTSGQASEPYHHVMIIDGNDERGIDVGLMARETHALTRLQSHVDDCDAHKNRIFRRDCAEFLLETPNGNSVLVMACHFKSKGYGGMARSDAIRRREAERVAEIYAMRRESYEYIAIAGDLNDFPTREDCPLAPLIADTDLVDATEITGFNNGGHKGTFGYCRENQKIDYLLLSPALADRASEGGIFRKGMWPGSRPVRWDSYATVRSPANAASDHAAVWVDLQI